MDLLIVGRGGGSYEDLWAFNEEVVARAIHESAIPVISAVGHEIDFTISDFVADLRAPTPSAAAELAVSDSRELRENIILIQNRITQLFLKKIEFARERIRNIQTSYGYKKPINDIRQYAMQVDELSLKLEQSVSRKIFQNKEYCNQIKIRLRNLDPIKVLERGYSISYIEGRLIKDIKKVNIESEMQTEIASGMILSTVKQKKGKKNVKTDQNI